MTAPATAVRQRPASPSRLVARIFTVADCARMASIRSAAASSTCSQLSNTNSRDPALQRGGHALAHALARLLGDAQHRRHRVGHRRRISHRSQLENPDPVGEFIGQSAPRLRSPGGSCQPRPHRSTSPADEPCSASCTSASSDSRPMKLVAAGRRFPGFESSARNEGKSVRSPGARTWNTPTGARHITQPSRSQIEQINAAAAEPPSSRPPGSDRRARRPSPAPRG